MNRNKTSPGLGQSKATSTTTCQKCLQKGHYSYECKGSLQSRPYASRASRSQQLRNPRLKPALTETKLAEPVSDKPTKLGSHEDTAATEMLPIPVDGRVTSRSPERPAKRRRRSKSVSSDESVATISTKASHSDRDIERSAPTARNDRLESCGRSLDSPVRRRDVSSSRSRSPPRLKRDLDRRRGDAHTKRRTVDSDHELEFPAPVRASDHRDRHPRRRTSRSPNGRTGGGSRQRPYQARSLSPFSKRLALTQAMNAGL